MVGLGILGYFCYNLFYLLGIDVLPAQEAMILNYMWPAMIIIFSCLILKEKMTSRKIIATLMFLLGVTVVASEGDISKIASGNLKGIVFCFLAAISYLCWVLALDHGNTAIISNLAYLTPFISLIICAVILHENISWYSIMGLVMIVSGIIIHSLGKKEKK